MNELADLAAANTRNREERAGQPDCSADKEEEEGGGSNQAAVRVLAMRESRLVYDRRVPLLPDLMVRSVAGVRRSRIIDGGRR
jgi:hypothetical protein